MSKVLIVGFDPHKIAFGPERGLTSEGVAATGQATTDKLLTLGHEVESWLIGPNDDEKSLVELLSQRRFYIILIAAGLRGLPEDTLLFETVMNVIHRHGRSAALCFNGRPDNALDAILRYV